MAKSGKLELTWVGKDQRQRLEPRLLLEETARSYGDPASPNMLIRGDNLLALKALEQDFTGRIQCIYLDPPFNTQQAFEYYDDGVEHSLWLSMMRDRLEHHHKLLHKTGTLFVHIDDNELAYLMVVLDEIFGRQNRVSVCTFKQSSASGPKAVNPGIVTTSNFIVIYAKDKTCWKSFKTFVGTERDDRYSKFIANFEEPYSSWRLVGVRQALAAKLGIEAKELKKKLGDDFDRSIEEFVLENAPRVVRTARVAPKDVNELAREALDKSSKHHGVVFRSEREGKEPYYFLNSEQLLFYSTKAKFIDGKYVTGEALTTIWDDLLSNNLHKEGGVHFPNGKKPEALLKRVMDLSTQVGDWVLDSFGGSGTTAATAHKMRRNWLTIEMGEHAYTHCQPRLVRIVQGTDDSGITEAANWKGGGGFKFYELAETLLLSDETLDHYLLNPKYDAGMLIRAICKIENFRYSPRGRWHGYSSETHFIHVVTQMLNQQYLDMLCADLDEQDALLIYCTKRDAGLKLPSNVRIKRIPKDLLARCEFRADLK
jgi:adenine-specific DNA-methyltransferase